jgi:hypothetical protein
VALGQRDLAGLAVDKDLGSLAVTVRAFGYVKRFYFEDFCFFFEGFTLADFDKALLSVADGHSRNSFFVFIKSMIYKHVKIQKLHQTATVS